MDFAIFTPMAERLRKAAASLRRMADGAADPSELAPETADNLLAAARRIEGYAEVLDPTPVNDRTQGTPEEPKAA